MDPQRHQIEYPNRGPESIPRYSSVESAKEARKTVVYPSSEEALLFSITRIAHRQSMANGSGNVFMLPQRRFLIGEKMTVDKVSRLLRLIGCTMHNCRRKF